MGIFEVSEANQTAHCLEMKAYDYMLRFEKSFNGFSTVGNAYAFLNLCCKACAVELVHTKEEIEGMPNGAELLSVYPENDIGTYRDVLYFVGQMLGGFFCINRMGKLELRNACIDPRFKYVTRGCAEHVEWLGQKENLAGKGWAAGAGYGEKILAILKGILGIAGGMPSAGSAGGWYRVRKTWEDAASQKGAYKVLENAKECADGNPRYSVFDESGNVVYGGTEGFRPYLVRVSISDLNIRKGPGTDYSKTGEYTGIGCFTIVQVKDGAGSDAGWGRLKSRAGWIALDFCEKI